MLYLIIHLSKILTVIYKHTSHISKKIVINQIIKTNYQT
jgi:hypothetical protein